MANIDQYIEQIENARYGNEVRQAIVDALTAMNAEISSSGVTSFNERRGDVVSANGDYNISQISATGGTQGQVPVVNSHGGFTMRDMTGEVVELNQLTDVNISSPSDGQVLKYDSTNEEWVNGNDAGGTTVVANPSGTASENLTKLQVGDSIYDIPTGGDGGILPAPLFSEETSYTKGDYVTYNGNTYRFTTDKSAGAWDSTKVEQEYAMGARVTSGKKSGTILGSYATAEGQNTEASGFYSHAEGANTIASGFYSHAEGSGTTASGQYSHAEGQNTEASGNSSHAEGYSTKASGYYSHAEGCHTEALNNFSHAEGYNTKTGASYQHVQGTYNIGKSTTLFEIGNGTADDARSNAFEVDTDGNVTVYGNLTVVGTITHG